MRSIQFSRWLVIASVAALLLAACGGGAATATPQPTAAPTRQPTATVAVQATATTSATVRPTATAAPSGQPTATVAAPTATPRPTVTVAPTVPPAAAGKYGGVLKKGATGDAASWDPLKEVSVNTQDLTQPSYDQLVTINPVKESEIIPQLAESWTVSSDNMTYTFKLRQGIKFTSGDALTSKDYKFTYESILKPPAGIAAPIQGSLVAIDTVSAPDDYTLVIKLKGPDASILASLGQGRALIVSKNLVDKEGRERLAKWPPVGTGPYKGEADGWIRGVSAKVVRNPDYWIKGRPYLDAFQTFVIPDQGTRLAAFLTGQVNFDYIFYTGDEEKEARARLGNKLAVQVTASTDWYSVEMNVREAPFNDIRVRKAVALGADKFGFISVMKRGRASLGGIISPGTGWELPEAELAKFEGYKDDRAANVARAKQLLNEAGFPSGFKVRSYFIRNQQKYVDDSIFVKASLAEVGITGDMQLVDNAKFFGELVDPKNWVISVQEHRTPLTDPNSAYQVFHLCKASRNYTGMCDPKVQELYDVQNVAADPAKRKALVWDLERYALGLYHNPIISYTQAYNGYYANIKGYNFHVSASSNRQLREVWME